MNLDTSTATGLLTLVGAIAEFERALMLERQREGIAKAKAEGKQGRKPTAQEKAAEVAGEGSRGRGKRDCPPARDFEDERLSRDGQGDVTLHSC